MDQAALTVSFNLHSPCTLAWLLRQTLQSMSVKGSALSDSRGHKEALTEAPETGIFLKAVPVPL